MNRNYISHLPLYLLCFSTLALLLSMQRLMHNIVFNGILPISTTETFAKFGGDLTKIILFYKHLQLLEKNR